MRLRRAPIVIQLLAVLFMATPAAVQAESLRDHYNQPLEQRELWWGLIPQSPVGPHASGAPAVWAVAKRPLLGAAEASRPEHCWVSSRPASGSGAPPLY